MKKKLLSLLAISLFALTLTAQSAEEPEFVGECILVKADNSTVPLENS